MIDGICNIHTCKAVPLSPGSMNSTLHEWGDLVHRLDKLHVTRLESSPLKVKRMSGAMGTT